MAWGYGVACPKPARGSRKRAKKKRKRAESKATKAIRAEVFERDHHMCRCCGTRPAQSMHEIVPRSLGGKVSLDNSIALCGSGTTGCHGYCQSYRIWIDGRDAMKPLTFTPATQQAREWMNGETR